MRILLDTNVLIDIYTQRPPEGDIAKKLIVMSSFGDAELWVSAKSFTDIFYVLSKSHTNQQIYAAFCESLKWLHICSVEANDVNLAIERAWEDFEDCLVAICAEKVQAEYLITRDRSGFTKSQTLTMTPSEFFDFVEREFRLVYEEMELIESDFE